LPYQRPSSSADCARELFNGSNGLASLVDYTRKKFFGWGVPIFCDCRHKWSSLPRAQLLDQSVSLKFSLTLWEPGYDIFVLWNRPKTSSCQLPYQQPSSSTDCDRELFKGSNGSASLLVCTRKKIICWGLRIFCEWRHKWSSFWPFWLMLPGLGPNR